MPITSNWWAFGTCSVYYEPKIKFMHSTTQTENNNTNSHAQDTNEKPDKFIFDWNALIAGRKHVPSDNPPAKPLPRAKSYC